MRKLYQVCCFNSPVAEVIPDPEEGLRIVLFKNSKLPDFIKFDSYKAAKHFALFIMGFCEEIPVTIMEVN